MPYIVIVISKLAVEVITATLGVMFYYVLFKLIFQQKPVKPKEIRENEHIYYPFRFYVPMAKLICEYIGLVLIMVSLQLWLREDWAVGRDVGIVCIAYALVVLFVPFEKKVNRVIVNNEGITLECYKGVPFHYSPDQYEGGEGKNLYFSGPEGKCKTEKLHFLCREDREAVVQDMNKLKKDGRLTEERFSTVQELREIENRQFQEEKQKLYADTGRYEAYLKEEASKRLTTSQKRELVSRIQAGDMMGAIKQCREWTGLGLKEAKDMVEQYQICLVVEEEKNDGPTLVNEPDRFYDGLKSDAEIRELDKKYSEESEKWQKLYADPTRYDAFLRQAAKQVSETRRREIVQLAQNGEMVKAIKLFRNTTGLSLRVSHDLVMAYKTYLAADDRNE